MNENEIKVFTGETLPEKREIPQEGMMQMRSQFVAAMWVPVPRNEEQIMERIEKIAQKVGNAFFYLWPVKNKDGSISMISGGTIDLAETILYYWSNIAIEHDIQDLGDKWKIKHILIDFERGLQWPRTTIVHKPKDSAGGWDRDRWERMSLNRANSFNLRDLVFSVIPRWMRDQIIEKAKVAEIKRSETEFDRGEAINLFTLFKLDYGIEKADILNFINESDVTRQNYFKIKNIFAQLKRGDVKAKDILKGEKQSNKKEEKRQAVKTEEKPKEKAPSNKDHKKETPFQLAIKSLELRNIDQNEICAFFNIEDISDLDCEEGIQDLQKVVTNIEGEKMTVEEFKRIGVERFEMRMKEKK